LRDTRWLFELVDLRLLSFVRRHEQIDPSFKISSFAPQICPRFHEGLDADPRKDRSNASHIHQPNVGTLAALNTPALWA
jgi:hypothetical protein